MLFTVIPPHGKTWNHPHALRRRYSTTLFSFDIQSRARAGVLGRLGHLPPYHFGRSPCGFVSYFLLVRQWIDFPYASPAATIATGGTYDIAASPRDCPGVRITPPPSSARAYAGKSRKGAKRPQDLPLRDFSAYAIPYHQGVIRTPRRACRNPAFHFR